MIFPTVGPVVPTCTSIQWLNNLLLDTHAEIFGEDDTSDGDQEEHTSRTGTDGKKRKIRRARFTEKEKIEIVFHSQKNPLLSQKDLIEWSERKFDMEKPLFKAAMSKWFKYKERLLKVSGTTTSQYVLSMKTKHDPDFFYLENELWA